MSSKLNKNQQSIWTDQRPTMDDDQETYISERTSAPSSNKRVSFSQQPVHSTKDAHTLQYFYNQLPDNGIPLATQYKQAKEQEKKSKKSYRKAAPGQGNLVPLPERPPEFSENYYPYTYYSQLRFPEKPKLYQQTIDGQLVPNESLDLSRYIHEPAESSPRKKRRRHHHHKKSTKYQYNPEKQNFEPTTQKPLMPVSPAKENVNTETKPNNNLTEPLTHSLPPTNKSKHHHHHHHHRHHHNHSPDKEYVDAEFQVIDVSFKKSERSPFFQRPKNPFQLPPPNIYNPTSFLPPVPQPYYHSQSLNTNWQDTPKLSPVKTRPLDFYDRYLNTVIRNKLIADN